MGEEWIVDLSAEIEIARKSSTGTTASFPEGRIKPSIFRVPKIFRDLNEGAYIPKTASFGPYHHGKEHLKPMEKHKHRVVRSFFVNINKKPVKDVVAMMRKEVRSLMESYNGLEEWWTWDVNRFLELMILDGCFLLELSLALDGKYEGLDPIFTDQFIRRALHMDTMLVENQLPTPVLAILLDGVDDQSIRRLGRVGDREWGLHILDGIRREYSRGCYRYDLSIVIPPATELFEAGVRICKSKTNSYNDISFSEGVLSLPVITIGNNTETLLLNFIAFEHVYGKTFGVSSYVYFMDGLINTAADVALLRKEGIIHGWAGSDDDITALFDRLSKGVVFICKNEDNVNEELMKYCRRMWPKLRAGFVRTYCRSPWVLISVLGAIILLFLTVVQSVYAVLSNYHHS